MELRLGNMPSARQVLDGAAVHAWYGLRFATARRFGLPESAEGRLGARRLVEVPIFPQRPSRLSIAMGQGEVNPQSEDAFFANVWAPESADGLPVILFLHGGAWMTGGGSMPWYDGGMLAARGAVVVTVNYRLGPFGHLGASADHEFPLPVADLLLALDWTVTNIAGYGGDPQRITVAGQSAGAWYGHLLSLLPDARGKIHRLALLSMGTRKPWSRQTRSRVTASAGRMVEPDNLGTAPVDAVLGAGLRALPPPDPNLGMAPAAYLPMASTGLPSAFLDPVGASTDTSVEATYLRFTAQESAIFFVDSTRHLEATQDQVDEALGPWDPADLPAVLKRRGNYAGSSSGLSPYRQLVAASSWRQFQRFPAEFAEALRADGAKAHLDVFEEQSQQPGLLAAHCFDLPFQFGNRSAWQDAPMLAGYDDEKFTEVSGQLVRDLVHFAAGAGPYA